MGAFIHLYLLICPSCRCLQLQVWGRQGKKKTQGTPRCVFSWVLRALNRVSAFLALSESPMFDSHIINICGFPSYSAGGTGRGTSAQSSQKRRYEVTLSFYSVFLSQQNALRARSTLSSFRFPPAWSGEHMSVCSVEGKGEWLWRRRAGRTVCGAQVRFPTLQPFRHRGCPCSSQLRAHCWEPQISTSSTKGPAPPLG